MNFRKLFIVALALSILIPGTWKSRDAFAGNQQNFYQDLVRQGKILDGQVVVQMERGHAEQVIQSQSIKAQEKLTSDHDLIKGFKRVDLRPGVSVSDAIAEIRKQPGVAYVGPQFVYRADVVPNDTSFASQWSLHNVGQVPPGGTPDADIDAPEGWDHSIGSATVVVAVVDSGVQFEHTDFAGRIWVNPEEAAANGGLGCTSLPDLVDNDGNGFVDDCNGADFVTASGPFGGMGNNFPADNDPSPCGTNWATPDAGDTGDCDGLNNKVDPPTPVGADALVAHGTHVAGIIGAVQNNSFGISGVSPGVLVMPVRALTEDGFGTTSDVVAAMNYAMMEGADIINMSFGSDGFDLSFDAVVNAAQAADVVLVAAAGNLNENIVSGSDCDSPVCNDDPMDIGANGVIGVASTDHQDRKSSFSNYSSAGYVDIASPGSAIYSLCYDTPASPPCDTISEPAEFASMSGTSQATPHVSAVAALLRSSYSLSAAQVTNTLKATGDDIDAANAGLNACGQDCTTGPNGQLGAGRLNAKNVFGPLIVNMAPSSGVRGVTMDVGIGGINTHFGPGSSVSFGEGIVVNLLSCSSAIACTANITITNSAPLGAHAVTVATGGELANGNAKFTVTDSILRLSGSNRRATAIEVSKNGFPSAASADAVVIARDDTFPDSLAGSPLASLAKAPLLFTKSSTLDTTVREEILRVLDPSSDAEPDIYILGQTAAVSSGVEAALNALNPQWQVKRVGGANRSQTAVMIADEMGALRGGPPDTVFIATQKDFPDALAGSVPASDVTVNAKRIPILLSDTHALTQATREYLEAYKSSISTAFILGGTSALSSSVHNQLGLFVPNITRLAGNDRYSTATTIAEQFYKGPVSASFATGQNFPDALAAGWHSGLRSSPLLLIKGTSTPQSTIDYVRGHSSTLLGGFMYGGTAVISDAVKSLLESIL
jgi:subtilisin family serine protease/putative cell wall-binding protein